MRWGLDKLRKSNILDDITDNIGKATAAVVVKAIPELAPIIKVTEPLMASVSKSGQHKLMDAALKWAGDNEENNDDDQN